MIKKIFFLCLILFFYVRPVWSEDLSDLRRENDCLEAEVSLASERQNYFIFDKSVNTIYLKVRGFVLRSWKFEKVRSFKDPVECKPLSLLRKDPPFPIKEIKVKPEDKEENRVQDDFELNVVEISDMPSTYRFFLENDLVIMISQDPKGNFSALKKAWQDLQWYTVEPLVLGWQILKKKEPPIIMKITTQNTHEAQCLFWAFGEGTKCIIKN